MNKSLLFIFLIISQLSLTTCSQSNFKSKPWLNGKLSFDERVELLINVLTLEEKIAQLLNASAAINRLDIKSYDWWNEALHGVARGPKATVFPQAIGLAATFDVHLIQNVGNAISDEARAVNNYLLKNNAESIRYMGLTFWSPNVNIFRDPRWGRGQETYGEDPFLSGEIGASFIKGMQGNHPKYLKTAACAKHYAVHSGPEAQRHSFNAIVNPQDLQETYLPAFKACVDAGVEAIMCAYNRTNNEACCGSKSLLQTILRDNWSFKGHVVSDCGAIKNFHKSHKLTNTPEESAALALKSGTNLNCGQTYKKLKNAFDQGLVSEEDINNGLRPLLKTRFKLGMFDASNSNPYSNIGLAKIHSTENINLSRKVAQKSIVLLQNKNNVLPLKKEISQLYVGGPFAGEIRTLLGNYYGLSSNLVTLLEGIVGKVSPITRVQYRAGVMMNQPNKNKGNNFSSLASNVDATIVTLGLTIVMEGEENEAIGSSDKGDNMSMKLPDNQLDYLRKMRGKHNKPIIAVVFAGSPVDLTEVSELADAIIYAWYPGEQGGNAIADVIFGDVSPSGKLPITFPKNTTQLPSFENYSMKGRTYKYMVKEPMYPFGFGLTYDDLKISDLSISSKIIKNNEEQMVQATLTNTGNSAFEDVVQLYISLKNNNQGVPFTSLKEFKRVVLKPGESKKITFNLDEKAFYYFDKSGFEKRHLGDATITIGNASPGKRSIALGATLQTIKVHVK